MESPGAKHRLFPSAVVHLPGMAGVPVDRESFCAPMPEGELSKPTALTHIR